MSAPLPLLTPVTINVGAGKPELLGVICFGPASVEFSSGSNWVGCRLTSTSLGQGKNDGSVLGKRYFNAGGDNNGVFVRDTQVKRREDMTKLEELKLKREIAKFTAEVTGAMPTTLTYTAVKAPQTDANMATVSAPVQSDKPLTRLEILKQRRQKLAAAHSGKTPPGSRSSSRSPPPPKNRDNTEEPTNDVEKVAATIDQEVATKPAATTTTTTTSVKSSGEGTITTGDDALHAALSEISALKTVLEAQRVKISTQQTQHSSEVTATNQILEAQRAKLMDRAQKEASLKEEVAALNIVLEEQRQEIKKLSTSSPPTMTSGVSDASQVQQKHDAELRTRQQKHDAELKSQQQKHDAELKLYREREESLKGELTAINKIVSVQREKIKELSEKSREPTSTSASTSIDQVIGENNNKNDNSEALRHEVAQLSSTLAALRSSQKLNESEHAKAKALLTAQIATLSRSNQKLSSEWSVTNTHLESLVMERDEAVATNTTLEERVEELSMDLEMMELEKEELAEEVEELRNNSSLIGSDSKGAADKEDDLKQQNHRMRDALAKLRAHSHREQAALSKDLKLAQSQLASYGDLAGKVAELSAHKKSSEEQIDILKSQIDAGEAYESMLEEITSKNLDLEETISSQLSSIRDLEEQLEISGEMEEVQAEEVKSLTADIGAKDVAIQTLQEAIKVQKVKEEAKANTIEKFKKLCEDLRIENTALRNSCEGEGEEKRKLVEYSQQALAQKRKYQKIAAHAADLEKRLVAMRIDEADKMMRIGRIEAWLPKELVREERAAVEGEGVLLGVAVTSFVGVKVAQEKSGDLECGQAAEISSLMVEGGMAALKILIAAGKAKDIELSRKISVIGTNGGLDFGGLRTVTRRIVDELVKIDIFEDDDGCAKIDDKLLLDFREKITDLRQAVQQYTEDLTIQAMISDENCDIRGYRVDKYLLIGKTLTTIALKCGVRGAKEDVLPRLRKLNVEACELSQNVSVDNVGKFNDTGEEVLVWVDSIRKMIDTNCDSESVDICLEKVKTLSKQLGAGGADVGITATAMPKKWLLSAVASDPTATWTFVSNLIPDGSGFSSRNAAVKNNLKGGQLGRNKVRELESRIQDAENGKSEKESEAKIYRTKLKNLEAILTEQEATLKSAGREAQSTARTEEVEKENKMLVEALDVLQRQVTAAESELKSLKGAGAAGGGTVGTKTVVGSRGSINTTTSAATSSPGSEDRNAKSQLNFIRPLLRAVQREIGVLKNQELHDIIAEFDEKLFFQRQQQKNNNTQNKISRDNIKIATDRLRNLQANACVVKIGEGGGRAKVIQLKRSKSEAVKTLQSVVEKTTRACFLVAP